MNRRNWLNLYRKLVDVTDMDYFNSAISAQFQQETLSRAKVGVDFGKYASPFAVTLSGAGMTLSVAPGLAHDPIGQIVEVATTQSGIAITSHATLAKWSLLVLRYSQSNNTAIAMPSNPLVSTWLNLLDSFTLAIVDGTPSGSPAYPAKGASDIVLAGIKIPAASTLATSSTVDLSVREMSRTAGSEFDAIVGAAIGCTHSTLQSAIDSCVDGARILVLDLQNNLNSSIAVSRNYMTIEFRNNAGFNKGSGSATIGMVISGNRNRVLGARISGWTTAINLTGNYNMIRDNWFIVNTTDFTDVAGTNSVEGNVNE